MRLISGRWLVLAVLLLAAAEMLHAGQIYGTIVLGGQGLKEAKIETVRPGGGRGRPSRLRVPDPRPQQGQCTLTCQLLGPDGSIFSSRTTAYKF